MNSALQTLLEGIRVLSARVAKYWSLAVLFVSGIAAFLLREQSFWPWLLVGALATIPFNFAYASGRSDFRKKAFSIVQEFILVFVAVLLALSQARWEENRSTRVSLSNLIAMAQTEIAFTHKNLPLLFRSPLCVSFEGLGGEACAAELKNYPLQLPFLRRLRDSEALTDLLSTRSIHSLNYYGIAAEALVRDFEPILEEATILYKELTSLDIELNALNSDVSASNESHGLLGSWAVRKSKSEGISVYELRRIAEDEDSMAREKRLEWIKRDLISRQSHFQSTGLSYLWHLEALHAMLCLIDKEINGTLASGWTQGIEPSPVFDFPIPPEDLVLHVPPMPAEYLEAHGCLDREIYIKHIEHCKHTEH